MKRINLILSTISLALLLSACGGGGETSVGGDSSGQIAVSSCPTYTTLNSGDTLVKETNDTTVTIRSVDSTTNEVCVNTGSAHILR